MQSAMALAMKLHTQNPGCRPIEVLDRTLKSNNIRVFVQPMPDCVGGFAKPYRGQWFIFVNRNHPPRRRRFTLAHELYHALCGHQPSLQAVESNGAPVERKADHFAACLLMPAGECGRLICQGYSVNAIADAFGVSIETARKRVQELQTEPAVGGE